MLKLGIGFIQEILLRLPIDSIAFFCKTEKFVQDSAKSDFFWKLMLKRDFPEQLVCENFHKDVYFEFLVAKRLGYQAGPIALDPTETITFIKTPFLPIEVTTFDDKVRILPHWELTPLGSIPLYIFPHDRKFFISKRNFGESWTNLLCPREYFTVEEAEKFIQDKIKEGYLVSKCGFIKQNPLLTSLKSNGLVIEIKE